MMVHNDTVDFLFPPRRARPAAAQARQAYKEWLAIEPFKEPIAHCGMAAVDFVDERYEESSKGFQVCFSLASESVEDTDEVHGGLDDMGWDPFFRAVTSENFKNLGCSKGDAITSRDTLRRMFRHVYQTLGQLTPSPQRPPGKQVVAILCPGRPQVPRKDGKWAPSSLESGISGAEGAVIYMATELVKLGYWVEVYGNPPAKERGLLQPGGVVWLPLRNFDVDDTKIDIFVAHRSCENLFSSARVNFLWLHDVIVECFGQAGIYAGVSGIFALSQYHASMLPKTVRSKIVVTRNGLDPVSFIDGPNHPYKFIYASDPARGLKTVLLNWAKIRQGVPNAQLAVYYGFSSMSNVTEKDELLTLLKQPGVSYIGMVGHHQLSTAFAEAGSMIYPTGFPEISCINAMKAQANGCFPVSSRFAALIETSKYDMGPLKPPPHGDIEGHPAWQQEWVERVIEVAQAGAKLASKREEMKAWARARFEWAGVALQWHRLFQEAHRTASEKTRDVEMEELIRMAKENVSCAPCWNRMGVIHGNNGRGAESMAAYNKAISINPYEGQAYSNMGFAASKVGGLREAIEWYMKAIKVQPQQVEAYINLGAAHKDLDELGTALWSLRRAVSLRPDSSDAHYNAAQIHDQRGDFSESMHGFSQTLHYMERGLRDRNTSRICSTMPGWPEEYCSTPACPTGSWRLIKGAPCKGEQGITCRHTATTWDRYGYQYGPKWAGDPTGAVPPRGHVVAVGGPVWSNLLYRDKTSWVAIVEKGTVAGVSGSVTAGCKVLLSVHNSYVPVHRDMLDHPGTGLNPTVHFRKLASIVQMSQMAYYHFILEGLPRLALLMPTLQADPKIRLLGPSPGFAGDFLRYLGFDKYVSYQPGTRKYHAEKLYISDWRSSDPRPGTRFFAPRHAMIEARRLFLSRLSPSQPGTISSADATLHETPLLVYVSRADAQYRRVTNEAAVLASLQAVAEANGAEVVVFLGNETSAAQTVRLFSKAWLVVGVHGGGLSNVLFTREGAALLEFALPEGTMRYYAHAAMALGIDYWVVPAPPDAFRKNFVIDPKKVQDTAQKAWPKRAPRKPGY